MKQLKKLITKALLAGTALCFVLFLLSCGKQDEQKKGGKGGGRAAPVEVVAIEHGPITLFRTFNGSLEPRAEFVAAPKVGGRVERLAVKLADTVQNGQIIAELDNDEYIQAVAQARADLAVANANMVEAKSALTIAAREFERVETLKKRGVASESQYDEAMANQSAKQAQLEVAKAQVTRAEAFLETANIRLSYTKVTANWSGSDNPRVVAERYVDEGHTVSANAALLLIVELNPITGIIFVTEKDYARLQPGQTAQLSTDAFPGETFEGRIARISPVFRRETRQARVELTIDNPKLRLKPGMFIRATVKLDSEMDATIVSEAALTSRNDHTGIFVVNEGKMTVSWRPVQVGIRQGDRVQVMGEGLTGRVVSLGHQLIDDGSTIIISESVSENKPEKAATP
ncbi:MAG: efflux RND transporter periplasmic adaptor subunit [Proteobacteria bacterium]|nr:efflux RND transporter periplasmic adaptor subunit [Pseudomonadota bacterium]MBU1708407.1 efflux RND transporter periplasmic adaptor subunit [Pseudomonadota bacterium]